MGCERTRMAHTVRASRGSCEGYVLRRCPCEYSYRQPKFGPEADGTLIWR